MRSRGGEAERQRDGEVAAAAWAAAVSWLSVVLGRRQGESPKRPPEQRKWRRDTPTSKFPALHLTFTFTWPASSLLCQAPVPRTLRLSKET